MTACPPIDELQKMLDGELSAERNEHVSTHVDSCTACLESLDELSTIPAYWYEDSQYANEQMGRLLPEEIARIAQSPPAPVLTGQKLGVYELQIVLGRGGMGRFTRPNIPSSSEW
jgi:anti-sigma factor RsiW